MADTTLEGSYKPSELNLDVEKEMARLKGQALISWDKEARNLRWFGLNDGMSVLEIGSGPGYVTEQLLKMLPESHITQFERDPDMVRRSERLLSPSYTGRFTIIEGDVLHMDLADSSFDFALARYLFQHLPDPLAALREILRVLKPGGILAITDVDDGIAHIFEPPSPEADAIEAKVAAMQAEKGGNRYIGRKLWRLMTKAGFEGLDLEAILIHSDQGTMDLLMPTEWDPGAVQPLLDMGVLTEEEVEVMHREHIRFHTSPDKYAMFALVMARGQKGNSN